MTESAPAVRLDDVRFAWAHGGQDVLDIATLDIPRGQRFFIEGPSGSGKSTLLSVLGGVNVPRTGSAEVLGIGLGGLSGGRRDRFRADHVGFVFQMFNLVPYLSMVDNVALPCRFSKRRHARATQAGGVAAEAKRLLAALELDTISMATRNVTELSIGQQQRVAVARALIGAPEIIIADEPTSALDEGTRSRFIELLFSECDAAGATVVFVSHDPRLAAHFDRRASLSELNRAARAH